MSDEINARADNFDPPFKVSRQQVFGYRERYGVIIENIRKNSEHEALNSGLAVVAVRVRKLQELARILEQDIFSGDRDTIWLPQVKGVGSGNLAQIVDYEEFNTAEIAQYRAVLEDIAKETGGRVQKADFTSGGKPISVNVYLPDNKRNDEPG